MQLSYISLPLSQHKHRIATVCAHYNIMTHRHEAVRMQLTMSARIMSIPRAATEC